MNSLSERGAKLAQNPARIDFELFMEAAENLYHPEDNPEGAFPLNVAENVLMIERMQQKMERIMVTEQLPAWVNQYTGMLGHPETLEIIAQFMRTYFKSEAIQAENIAFSAGASASLEVCSFVLAHPGDVVVIPAPAYPMYTNDLGVKSGMERYDLQTHFEIAEHDSLALVTPAHLDQALADIQRQGKTFRMLMITSPDNPSGAVYSLEQLVELADWCEAHQIHLVVNEIYALSEIRDEEAASSSPRFQSFASLMAKRHSDYLHLIYALSKDFAASGLRFGVIHSLNPAMMKALEGANIPHLVSNLTQWVIGGVFKDDDFIADYVRENQQMITESYRLVTATLDDLDIPYSPSRGSLFVWADFSRFMPANDAQAEEDLWVAIYRNSGVLLTPGFGFQHQKHGLFRIVHTATRIEHLTVAMERMAAYLRNL